MKRVIIILSLCIAGIFSSHAQERCDTLKWKGLKTDYGGMTDGNSFYRIGTLDGAVIDIDTLSILAFQYKGLNVSNDTFFLGESVGIALFCLFYADTGFIGMFKGQAYTYSFGRDFLPNDTMEMVFGSYFNLPVMINSIKENWGIELEGISYWQVLMGVGATSKDGTYSESVFYAGMDTSNFRVVRGGVGIVETPLMESLRVYPNPAKNQLTIECRDGARPVPTVEVYSVVGQKLMQLPCRDVINHVSTIDVSHLAKGMYFLKAGNKTVRFVKE